MSETVDITDDAGAVVISIETLRAARHLRPDKPGECSHRSVLVSEIEAWFECKGCHAKINPTAWVMKIAEEWAHVRRTYQSARAENARRALRQYVVCDCGKRVPVVTRSEDERRRQATREVRLEKALEAIRVLVPEAAAKYAPELARKALAERDP